MSWAEYITKHCVICQIKWARPRGITPTQLIQVSNSLHSDLNQICNILYTRGQFPSRVPLDVRKIKGPYYPKLFLILGTGDLSVLLKVLANVKGIRWNSNKQIDDSSQWNVSSKLFDMDTSKKDQNLKTALLNLRDNSTNSPILRYLELNDSNYLNDTIASYLKQKVPLYDSNQYEFKWNHDNVRHPSSQGSHQVYSTEPDIIQLKPEIFTNLNGLPNDMKLWLRDIKYSQDWDKLLDLNPRQNDQLDVLLHGFKGL